MNKYHKWALLASGVAAVLLAWAIAFAVLSVYELDHDGKIPAVKVGPKLWRVKTRELEPMLGKRGLAV